MVGFDSLFGGIYKGRRVLVTGHTGFKGSWLVRWLDLMGAEVYAYALPPATTPNHISLIKVRMQEKTGDLRDGDTLKAFVRDVRPDIVFHLAAQALVRPSYQDPVETFSTNIMGTLHVFEACRATDSVRAIVNVTSDKCYENKEWIWGYRENDRMGGYDPYSASKGMAELLTASYRNSFFNTAHYGTAHHVLLASGRAGNVIGGGDWATDRLIPDVVKAAHTGRSVHIRSPQATRPWQHVLEPLSGYLHLGWKLLEGQAAFAEGWNFGPGMDSNISVRHIVERAADIWDAITPDFSDNPANLHEANLLMLDCSKAHKRLHWRPVWDMDTTLRKTINWYKDYYQKGVIRTDNDIADYVRDARKVKPEWAR